MPRSSVRPTNCPSTAISTPPRGPWASPVATGNVQSSAGAQAEETAAAGADPDRVGADRGGQLSKPGRGGFVVDDETVAKTNGGGTRSPAGIIADADDQGVWVRFDEGLTRVYVEGIANPV